MPQGEIKAISIYITRSGNKLENLPCKGKRHQFNLYKPTFSIKAHFLIRNYQVCNNSYKLVTRMATILVFEKIKLLKIKSIVPSFHRTGTPPLTRFFWA